MAFIEQDECVLGVFRDCSASPETREWRGRIDQNDQITLDAIYDPSEGAGQPRRPQCCLGALRRPDEASAWSLLACRNQDCRNANDREHLGVLIERGPEAPDGRRVGISELPGPAADADGQLALIQGVSPTEDGVWSLSGSPIRLFPASDARMVADASDGAYVVGAGQVTRSDGAQARLPSLANSLLPLNPGVAVMTSTSVHVFRPDLPSPDRLRSFSFESGAPVTLGVDGEGRPVVLTMGPAAVTVFDVNLSVVSQTPLDRNFVARPRARGVWQGGALHTLAQCHDAFDTLPRCVWSVDPDSGVVTRTGLADVMTLGRLTAVADRLWVPDEAGFVHALAPAEGAAWAPSPRRRFGLPAPGGLTSGPDREGRCRVFERAGRRVWTVEPADGKG